MNTWELTYIRLYKLAADNTRQGMILLQKPCCVSCGGGRNSNRVNVKRRLEPRIAGALRSATTDALPQQPIILQLAGVSSHACGQELIAFGIEVQLVGQK